MESIVDTYEWNQHFLLETFHEDKKEKVVALTYLS